GDVAHVIVVPETCSRLQIPRLAVECAPAQNPKLTLPGGPGRAVARGAAVGVVPAILDPLGGIACRVVKSERIRLERTDRLRLRGAGPAVPTIGLARAEIAPPPVVGVRPALGRILPLGL